MDHLKAFLADHDLTQADLARGIGVSSAAVSKLFHGHFAPSKTRIDAILAFCRRYDSTITYEALFHEVRFGRADGRRKAS